jgi:hypothetical protein
MALNDWQITRGSYVIGTSSATLGVGITDPPNLWQNNVRSHDTEYQGKDGAHAGIDVRTALLLDWSFIIRSYAKDPDAVMDNLASARTAYAPSSTDVTITTVMPGSRTMVHTGRPRSFTADLTQLDLGIARCRIEFYVPSGVATSGTL